VNKRERVLAALHGEPVDRPPVTLWRHFHRQDQTSEGLAHATLGFARRYDLDLVKVTPSGLYAIEDWGASISQSGDDDAPPRLKRPVIETPEGWRRLAGLAVDHGSLGRGLQAVRAIGAGLGRDDAPPLLMTIFSPLTLAYKLAGDAMLQHLRQRPADLHFGLATIAETVARYSLAALAAGADGIFFAAQLARPSLLTADEYSAFGERYDRIVLEYLAPQKKLIILHLHGKDIFFDLANRYPVAAVSWHDREASPSLREAQEQTSRALMAGLERDLLANGSPEEVTEQVRDARQQTGGQRLILSSNCVLHPATPDANLQAAVRAAHET
jgi:uroporphyrinogen decarboxylase